MIIRIDDLELIRENNLNKKIVLLKGTFDLLHTGHIYAMEQAKNYGDILVIIVKPNIAVKSKGNNRPIIDELERTKQVDSIKYVDYTILANQDVKDNSYNDIKELQTIRYCEIVKKLKPDILVHPKNHKNPEDLEEVYSKLNTKIIELERNIDKPSTTEIINKIRNYKQ